MSASRQKRPLCTVISPAKWGPIADGPLWPSKTGFAVIPGCLQQTVQLKLLRFRPLDARSPSCCVQPNFSWHQSGARISGRGTRRSKTSNFSPERCTQPLLMKALTSACWAGGFANFSTRWIRKCRLRQTHRFIYRDQRSGRHSRRDLLTFGARF